MDKKKTNDISQNLAMLAKTPQGKEIILNLINVSTEILSFNVAANKCEI